MGAMTNSESGGLLPSPEPPNEEHTVKPAGRSRLDYWIAGVIVLAIAILAGKDMVKYLFTSAPPVGSSDPNPAAAEHINAGMRFYHSLDFVGAEGEFRKALQADPGSALAYNDLGDVLNNQRRWDEAIAALQKAVALDPSMALAKNNLAYSFEQKAHGGNGGANTEATRAAGEHVNAGMRFYGSADWPAAEAEFRKALQADPNSALAYNDLGAVLNNQGRWDEAIAALAKAIQLNPSSDLAKNNLAYSIAQKAHGGNGGK
jgi:Flp pilus assembly protein TadD